MSLQVFSREYLQSIPEKRKQEQIDNIIQGFKVDILNAAAMGGTSYRYVKSERGRVHSRHPPPPQLTNEELIAGFQERFPGCKVFYEESWVASSATTQTLVKGIVIDWS
jgi:hypothetical protein